MDINYYGELDPWSGLGHRSWFLTPLIRELTRALLFHDVVLVPPDNLFDHRLALPAFEALAPFVQAGLLTTTADLSIRAPADLLEDRLTQWAETVPDALSQVVPTDAERRTVHQHRVQSLNEMRDRWSALLPARWTLLRDVNAQILGFVARLRHRCAEHPEAPSSRLLLRAIDEVQHAGVTPSRTAILARMAAYHATASPPDIARAIVIVQTAYFELGAESHSSSSVGTGARRCRLFPGRFARLLRERGMSAAAGPDAPYAWHAAGDAARARWLRVGVDVDRLAALDAGALFEIATSPEWRALRATLQAEHGNEAMLDAVAATLRDVRDLRDGLVRLDAVVSRVRDVPPLPRDESSCRTEPPRPAPVLLPSPWQYGVQAVLGACFPAQAASAEEGRVEEDSIRFDLRTLTVTRASTGTRAAVRRSEGLLLALLIIAGDAGLTERDIKQLAFDVEKIDSGAARGVLDAWSPQWRERPERDRRRLCWAHTLKSRTNRSLQNVGVRVEDERGKGLWRLVHPAGPHHSVELTGTLWELLDLPAAPPPPADLPAPQATLWQTLANAAPSPLPLAALAQALGKSPDERAIKRTLHTVRRLRRRLLLTNATTRVLAAHKGHYALVPAAASTSGPAPQATPIEEPARDP